MNKEKSIQFDLINRIAQKILCGQATESEADMLFDLSKEGYEQASFYYGLYLLLIIKSERMALDWIKSKKTEPMHRKMQ